MKPGLPQWLLFALGFVTIASAVNVAYRVYTHRSLTTSLVVMIAFLLLGAIGNTYARRSSTKTE